MSQGIHGLVIVTRYRFVVLGYFLSFPYYISILYGFIPLGKEEIRYRFPENRNVCSEHAGIAFQAVIGT